MLQIKITVYLLCLSQEFSRRLQKVMEDLDVNLVFETISLEQIATLSLGNNDCLFVNQKFLYFEWLDIEFLRKINWVVISENSHVYYKTLVYPPVGYINNNMPANVLISKLIKVHNKLCSNNRTNQNQGLVLPGKTGNKVYLNSSSIQYASALGDHCKVYAILEGKQELDCFTIMMSLKTLEDKLDNNLHFRIHKSHLINYKYLDKIQDLESGEISLLNDITLPLARRRKREFSDFLIASGSSYA